MKPRLAPAPASGVTCAGDAPLYGWPSRAVLVRRVVDGTCDVWSSRGRRMEASPEAKKGVRIYGREEAADAEQ